MRAEHRGIQQWIKQQYGHRYQVAAEVDRRNYLPDRERDWYRPDVILRDGKGDVRYVIEVEGDPGRKALVGASVLADYSIGELGQQGKPRLIFVVYTERGIRQISNFIEKLRIAKQYCTHLDDVEVYSEADFKVLRL